ncbi:hypothetical protein [Candidatus Berkiella aquae]|uniref:Uncharacterized protein n=1 Tax=Candidatus Berkiella aquae TaxID=295108 RepID=A0A0Q9YMC7_9GAMM|nr:hypothetical protein [Candidatus Berkiella aquae]MCS5710414.1 hypothetical protein [Candidatus Berkiella aquae]
MAVTGVKGIREFRDDKVIALLGTSHQYDLTHLTLSQIEDLTFRIRELNITYSKILRGLNAEQCQKLSDAFRVHSTRALAQWSETQPEFKDPAQKQKLASVYHRAPHGAEMRKDAELFLQQKNMQALFLEPHHRLLFIKMAEAAHAMHDVIQEFGPLKNEIKSYLVFIAHCKQIFSDAFDSQLLSETERDALYTASKIFGWEVIVVGTIFDFKEKMPLIDILNKKSVQEQLQDTPTTSKALYPAQPDPAIGCAAFAAGKNDTRRMEVVLDNYLTDAGLKALINEQFEATGGANNTFMRFMAANPQCTERELIAFRHMLGQNCRMICEIKTHFAKNNDDVEFAEFFANLIAKASEQFDKVQWESLKSLFAELDDETLSDYYQKIIASFEGPFGEIAFAKGLNSTILNDSISNFNQLYPEYAFTRSKSNELWGRYAEVLEAFIPHLKAQIGQTTNGKTDKKLDRKNMVRTIIDLALYGGHQIGHALLRLDHDLTAEYEMVIGRIREMTQKMFHKPLPSNKTMLLLLVKYQTAQTDNLSSQLNQLLLDPVHKTLGRPEYTPDEKRAGLHMLYKATEEQQRLQAQRENAEQAAKRRNRSTSAPTSPAPK